MLKRVSTFGQVRKGYNELPELPTIDLPEWVQARYPDISNAIINQNKFNELLLDTITQMQEQIVRASTTEEN